MRNEKKSHNRTELAKNFLSRHELASAKREATKALLHNPDNAEAHLIIGLVDLLGAYNNFRLLEIDDCLTGVDAEALREEMDEQLERAEAGFSASTKADRSYSEAWANQASAAALLEQYPRAIELNEQALVVPHRLANLGLTRANLGWARFHSGDVVGAAKDLRQALQFSPNMCIANYRLGRVYFKREEWNKAATQFQTVVDNKDCPIQEAHFYLIRTMQKLSMTQDMQRAVTHCMALAPKSCIAAQCEAGL